MARKKAALSVVSGGGVTVHRAGVSLADRVKALTNDGEEILGFVYGVFKASERKLAPTRHQPDREVLTYDGVDVTVNEKIWAVEFMANRGWGKPAQKVEVEERTDREDSLKVEALELLKKIAGGT